jgi:hypothetical protein
MASPHSKSAPGAPREYPARQSPPLKLWQKIGHTVFVILGWVLFVWMWQLASGEPWDSAPLMFLIIGALIVSPLVTLFWIFHNMGIYRRKGPRKGMADVKPYYDVDWSGREVTADWATLAKARVVVIEIDEFGKNYRVASTR